MISPTSPSALSSYLSSAMDLAANAAREQNADKDSALKQFFPELDSSLLDPQESTKAVTQLGATGDAGNAFSSMIRNLTDDVSAKSAKAASDVEGVITGQGVPLHQAVISMQESSVSFQLMVEIRNKLLESYQELMRMQV